MASQEPCIYRVPSQLREVKPEAYRPRMLLIGPLNHSSKPNPANGDLRGSISYLEYGMMEEHKKTYRNAFAGRPNGVAIIEEMRRTVQEYQEHIRASYAESTTWISPKIFVELILNDSIFIGEFILRIVKSREKIGDLIVDNPYYNSTVRDDLTLLENQLPYFYLKKLLNPIVREFIVDETVDQVNKTVDQVNKTVDQVNKTVDQVILKLFSVNNGGMIKDETEFNHFTDMFRCVYKESLDEIQTTELNNSESPIVDMKSADKLASVGVTLKTVEREYSLKVSFEGGCLMISSFPADESSNIILRNVIAYEQCHEINNAFTTNYIHFMNFLITTEEDVKILTSKGCLTNGVGRPSMVLEMMNSLSMGVLLSKKTQYHGIVDKVNTHYRSSGKRMWAKLRKVYFSDLWTGTATLAAISILLLTLAGTVASIIQAMGIKKKSS